MIFLNQLNWTSAVYARMLTVLFSSTVKKVFVFPSTTIVKVSKKTLVGLSFFFKEHSLCCYSQLLDIAAEDTPKRTNRFRISYIFSSVVYAHKILLSLTAHELHYLPSLWTIFFSAGWLEREIWDLYGLYFFGHFDLRRILTDYGFLGHPLRKDFPLSGFSEIYYALDRNGIIVVPVEFSQSFRIFR